MNFYWTTKTFFSGLFKLFYRHKTYGQEHLASGAAIIAPNHASFWDPPIIAISAGDDVSFLARASLFNSVLGPCLRRLKTFPVQGAESLESFKLICGLLKSGQKVVIFPEGHRTPDGKLGPFKPGIAMLAFRNHCPIIPTYIDGTYSIWERNRRFPRLFGRTACVFGSPIPCEPFLTMPKKEGQEAMVREVHKAIVALEEWYRDGAVGSPP